MTQIFIYSDLTELFFVSRYLASMFSAMTVLYYMRKRETRCVQGKLSLDLLLKEV